MAFSETYIQNSGYHCERCGNLDSRYRIVRMQYGAYPLHICTICSRDMARLCEAKVAHPSGSNQWILPRIELRSLIDPSGVGGDLTMESLRVEMTSYEDRLREHLRKLQHYETDRDSFIMNFRKSLREMFASIDRHLPKPV